MTPDVKHQVLVAIEQVEISGHGSVEIVIQNGKVLDIVIKERKRIN